MEDFVPYETVLKLEKKGYKGKTIRYHGHIYDVLKWLREEKKIHISPCCYKDDNISFAGWFYLIVEMRDSIWKYHDQEPQRDNSTATYESVAIDAIKYVLDNLI